MDTAKAIFRIHKIMASKTNKKEADKYIRNLVLNIMADLQDHNEFTPENFEEKLVDELQTFEKLEKKDVA